MLEAGQNKFRFISSRIERAPQSPTQMLYIGWNKVGRVRVFAMVPNLLHRIEPQSMRRQPFHYEPTGMLLPKQTNCFTMNIVMVQNHNKLSPQMSAENPEERHHLLGANIAGMDIEAQSQTPPFQGNRDRRDDRETVVALPAILSRRFALRRPCSATDRPQHKTTLIRKNDAISLPTRFFLYAANPAAASVGSLYRRVLEFWFLATPAQRMQDVPDVVGVIFYLNRQSCPY
jgi:hypothetical protein